MSSTRLPGKVLLPLAGAPMLARQIERLRRSCAIEQLVVATSADVEDDPIARLAEEVGVACHRGSLGDVLDRYYRAAEPYAPEYVVRLTGDCPLADWEVIDAVIEFARAGAYDYASNTLRPTWPDGLDVEVVRFGALAIAWREAVDPFDREHVMPFITRRPNRFRLGSFENDVDLSGLRWTVDEERDRLFVAEIYDRLYPADPHFKTSGILRLLDDHPELLEINAGIGRNEGSRKNVDGRGLTE